LRDLSRRLLPRTRQAIADASKTNGIPSPSPTPRPTVKVESLEEFELLESVPDAAEPPLELLPELADAVVPVLPEAAPVLVAVPELAPALLFDVDAGVEPKNGASLYAYTLLSRIQ
jgi:hypothetical protein